MWVLINYLDSSFLPIFSHLDFTNIQLYQKFLSVCKGHSLIFQAFWHPLKLPLCYKACIQNEKTQPMFALPYLKLRGKNEDIYLPFNNFKSRSFQTTPPPQWPSRIFSFLPPVHRSFQYLLSFIQPTFIARQTTRDVVSFPLHMHFFNVYFESSPEYSAFIDFAESFQKKAV